MDFSFLRSIPFIEYWMLGGVAMAVVVMVIAAAVGRE